jgi:hypothetical protein
MIRLLMFVGALALIGHAAKAQSHKPYAGLEQRAIKTLSDQEITDLKNGRGMGMALAAELNGYPGPIHSIDLADRLGLSADQVSKLKKLFEEMKAETIPIGATLMTQERLLNDDFAHRTVTPVSLERNTQQIGATQASLRAAHLKYHLATAAILTADQVKRYNELRGYAGDTAPEQHQHMHGQ